MIARVDDLFEQAQRGIFAYGDFLNETDSASVYAYAYKRRGELCVTLWGGFEESERKRLFVYPDYYDFDEMKDCIRAVEIRGSGFAELRHSSFLGALTSLGIDRAKMGDIVLLENSGILFADEKICEFLLSVPAPLERVARDSVRVFAYTPSKDFSVNRQFKEIYDTVASPRLDAVVSSLCNISREKAKALVTGGSVFINHLPCERPDSVISEGDRVTVRGSGKFIIESVGEKTKKDRYRLSAKKYI